MYFAKRPKEGYVSSDEEKNESKINSVPKEKENNVKRYGITRNVISNGFKNIASSEISTTNDIIGKKKTTVSDQSESDSEYSDNEETDENRLEPAIGPYDVELSERGFGGYSDRMTRINGIEPSKKLYPLREKEGNRHLGSLYDEVSDELIDNRKELNRRTELLKKSDLYMFSVLVAGNLEKQVEDLIEMNIDIPVGNIRGRNGTTNNDNMFSAELKLSSMKNFSSMLNNPLADGELKITPFFEAGMQNSISDLKLLSERHMSRMNRNLPYEPYNIHGNNNNNVKIPSLEEIISNKSLCRTQFAQFVAINIKISSAMDGKVTRLQKALPRLLKMKEMYAKNILTTISNRKK